MSNNPNRQITPGKGGFWPELTLRLKLILRLMADSRVSPLLKLLPVASLIYLFVPTDLLPIIPLDDAAILYLGGSMFIEMCPQEIVAEHTQALRLLAGRRPADEEKDIVVDAEYRDVGDSSSEEKNDF